MSIASTDANVIALVPRVHYLVALGYVILDRPGEDFDEHYVEMIGSFESLDDAKTCVDEHAGLIMDNDEQYLTIYKIDLNQCKIYDFHRSDLKEAVEEALREQRELESKNKPKRKLATEVNVQNYPSLLRLEKRSPEAAIQGNVPQVSQTFQEQQATKSTHYGKSEQPVPGGDFPRPNQGLVERTAGVQNAEQFVPITVTPKPKRLV